MSAFVENIKEWSLGASFVKSVVLKWLNQMYVEKNGTHWSCLSVAHIWFLKSLPSRISLAIDMKQKRKSFIFWEFIVVEPGLTNLKKGQLISEEALIKAQEEFGEDAFTAGIGAEAVREILVNLDLKKEQQKLRDSLKEIKSKVTEERTIKRLKLIESFINSGNKPSGWF